MTHKISLGIRILVVDDHPILRRGLVDIINSELRHRTIFEAGNGQEAITKFRMWHPEILIMDISMPGMNGLEAAKIILTESKQTKIILLSLYNDINYILEALEIGINGYVLKDDAVISIVKAIHQVAEGGTYLSEEVRENWANYLIRKGQNETRIPKNSPLSVREIEILRLVCRGFSVVQISNVLYISTATVNNHKAHLYKKTGCSNLATLINYAMTHGYYSPAINDEK